MIIRLQHAHLYSTMGDGHRTHLPSCGWQSPRQAGTHSTPRRLAEGLVSNKNDQQWLGFLVRDWHICLNWWFKVLLIAGVRGNRIYPPNKKKHLKLQWTVCSDGVCVCWNSSNIRIEKEERIALVPLYSDGCCILNSATLEKSVLQGSVVQAHLGRFVADSPNNQPKLLWSFRRTIDVPLVSLILLRRSPLFFL